MRKLLPVEAYLVDSPFSRYCSGRKFLFWEGDMNHIIIIIGIIAIISFFIFREWFFETDSVSHSKKGFPITRKKQRHPGGFF